ncbi:TIGR03086 family metal-binding protein [Streptomyces sp. ODS28]|uniref:TIGR03086 family metal-binding protein n=1 Tax=Streptomyces sp. ODS28 TaxID=3136688 RepID=UPI0031EA1F18
MYGSPEHAAELLERAVGYALGAVGPAGARDAGKETPCAGWDLDTLLRHACDGLGALREGIDAGYVGIPGPREEPAPGADPAAAFRLRAGRLLGAWAAVGSASRQVRVADLPITSSALAGAGALEVAVHGWDVARALGRPCAMPRALATALLELAHLLVPSPADRPPLFGPPLTPPPGAGPEPQLLSFLGRDPDWGVG